MELERYLATLTADTEAMAVAAERDLGAPVAACPGWSMTRLVDHTGRLHRWVSDMVRTGSMTHVDRALMPPAPEGDALLPWFRDGSRELVELLRWTDPDQPVWTWTSMKTAAFWSRRMAQETSVHRWDAEQATGDPAPIEPDIAADGIDELLDVFLPRARSEPEGPAGHIRMQATDIDRNWDIAMEGGEVDAGGTASDLALFLWNRIGPGAIDVTGDEATLRRWQAEVRID